MPPNRPILLDLNNPLFQEQLFALDVDEVVDVPLARSEIGRSASRVAA
ncbi:MAG TPA: hypothetical protein VF395_01585 [Polyangiaceae bacterium]